MSSQAKKSKLDLLVRVRYSNPLPAPPCPPKLLDIPTDPMRYARPEFLNSIATNHTFPMVVDAECGMPLDLSKWESLWTENADDSALNPDPSNLPKLDPRDEFLAYETVGPIVGGVTTSFVNNTNGQSVAPVSAVQPVSWLRKTEYISRGVEGSRGSLSQDSRNMVLDPVDISRTAQLETIETSFTACNEDFNLAEMRHPNKPNVTAVESYEFLPDVDIWANQYDLFRFAERPGERSVDMDDPRLTCAILRPMKSDQDSFLAYYLTPDDETALQFKERRSYLKPYEVPDDEEETIFHFVRDYETTKVEQEVPNEFLLLFEDDNAGQIKDEDIKIKSENQNKPKGAYYKNIERKMFLKKRRALSYEQYDDKWELMRVSHAVMSDIEENERQEALAEVVDPLFLIRDADGDIDVDAQQANDDAAEVFGDGLD